jgi:DNA-binding NarL/FixJ family response regulator
MNSQSHLWFGSGGARSLQAAATGSRKAPAPQPRVMIVEDEFFVAWHLETLAVEFGLDVIGLLPDGESAVEQFADAGADLVLMDIHLAGSIDGVEAARRIRERHDAAVIFISAFADSATVARIESVVPGAQILSKPVSTGRLRAAIGRALSASPR